MKKFLLYVILCIPASVLAVTLQVKEIATSFATNSVSVSTTNVSTVPASNFPGRYKVMIQNTDNVYDVSIGTHSSFTYANGFILKAATTTASVMTLPLTQGATIFGLGQANTTQSAVTIKVLELK